MKNLSVNAYYQYWQHIEKEIWNELFVCLDLCQNRYPSTLTYSSCSLLMRQACERAFSHDLASFLSFFSTRERARAHTYTYRHGAMRTSEYEHLFHFILKRERHWIKNRFIFFFSLLFFLPWTRSKRSDNNIPNSTEIFIAKEKVKKTLARIFFLSISIIFLHFFLLESHNLFFQMKSNTTYIMSQ